MEGNGVEVANPSNMWVPPAWFRLLIVTPIVYVACLAVLIASPLIHLVLAVLDLVDRNGWRFTRLGGIGVAFCVAEVMGLTIAFGLWVGSGFGWRIHSPRFQRAHNTVFGWWLESVTRALRFFLGYDVHIQGERITGPILAFARHAGPGDMFLLAHALIRLYRRQMITVGASKLLWDPVFDRLVRRSPSVFLDQNPADPGAALAQIEQACQAIGDDGVMIICPEGGNWTPRRWDQGIAHLESDGHPDRAERAARMTHVLPPRPAGAAAAIHARPDLTVVFVAHAGLDDLTSLGELWRKVPLRRTVEVGYWAVDHETIPTDPRETASWLFDEWERVDTWIDERTPDAT